MWCGAQPDSLDYFTGIYQELYRFVLSTQEETSCIYAYNTTNRRCQALFSIYGVCDFCFGGVSFLVWRADVRLVRVYE